MTDTLSLPRPRPGLLDIHAYIGGKSHVEGVERSHKLSSNENALGCSPRARDAYLAAADRLHLYPDGHSADLRAAVAKRYDLEPERLLFTAGSDEAFTLLCRGYLNPGDNAVQGEYGFLSYSIAVRSVQGVVRSAPEPDRRVDVDGLLALVDDRTRLVFLANPANPSGTWNSGEEVRRLHAGLPSDVILVLDGAYAEFCHDPAYEDGLALARGAHNVVVARTFSKLHGLAGLRVGWAYAPAEVVSVLDRIRGPFNINLPAQAAALAALNDDAFIAASLKHVAHWRIWLAEQLAELGLETWPSATNFVLVRFPGTGDKSAKAAEAFLASRGIIVRGVAGYGLTDSLRITLGLEHENRAVIAAIADFLRA
ncbi:histidinol-phosphate transaminase [Novosphingobium sp. FKTRR1]|uniref:histidinol-phosphate transaminase n=1 Tax=Novosphingobium sp. FKTRR1 TaxID=2879118 RepID=UPI001CF01C0B|nr:histidinol-phosphate transaminase [Novosphingobium sp. FKTRR1]